MRLGANRILISFVGLASAGFLSSCGSSGGPLAAAGIHVCAGQKDCLNVGGADLGVRAIFAPATDAARFESGEVAGSGRSAAVEMTYLVGGTSHFVENVSRHQAPSGCVPAAG